MKKLISSSLAVMLLMSGTSGAVFAKERDFVGHKKVHIVDKTEKKEKERKDKRQIEAMKSFNKQKEVAKKSINEFSRQEKEYQALQSRINEFLSKLSQLDKEKAEIIGRYVKKTR